MTDTEREVQKKEAGIPGGGERTRSRKVYTPNVDILEK